MAGNSPQQRPYYRRLVHSQHSQKIHTSSYAIIKNGKPYETQPHLVIDYKHHADPYDLLLKRIVTFVTILLDGVLLL